MYCVVREVRWLHKQVKIASDDDRMLSLVSEGQDLVTPATASSMDRTCSSNSFDISCDDNNTLFSSVTSSFAVENPILCFLLSAAVLPLSSPSTAIPPLSLPSPLSAAVDDNDDVSSSINGRIGLNITFCSFNNISCLSVLDMGGCSPGNAGLCFCITFLIICFKNKPSILLHHIRRLVANSIAFVTASFRRGVIVFSLVVSTLN